MASLTIGRGGHGPRSSTEGYDRVDPSTNSGLPTTREGNFDVSWNIPWVKDFQCRFRNAYTDRGIGRPQQAYRIIVNYDIPLL